MKQCRYVETKTGNAIQKHPMFWSLMIQTVLGVVYVSTHWQLPEYLPEDLIGQI